MNSVLQDYNNISELEINKRVSFYTGTDFLKEAIVLKIPDVVQYVRNIFSCLLAAQQSREIVEDISRQIVAARKQHGHIVNSIGYSVGAKIVDGRAYAQRQTREWFEYIAKTNDSICQIINIVYSLGKKQKEITAKAVLKKARDNELSKLSKAYYAAMRDAQEINDYSKHNLNLWGSELFSPDSMQNVDYFFVYNGKKTPFSDLMSEAKEHEIKHRIIQVLDYIFDVASHSAYGTRYYAVSSYDIEPDGFTGFVDELGIGDMSTFHIRFSTQRYKDGTYLITEARIETTEVPVAEIYLANLCRHNIDKLLLHGVGVCRCNTINVYKSNNLIGQYELKDDEEDIGPYLHFNRYRFVQCVK